MKYSDKNKQTAIKLWFEINQEEESSGRNFEEILEERLPEYNNEVQEMFKEVYTSLRN